MLRNLEASLKARSRADFKGRLGKGFKQSIEANVKDKLVFEENLDFARDFGLGESWILQRFLSDSSTLAQHTISVTEQNTNLGDEGPEGARGGVDLEQG